MKRLGTELLWWIGVLVIIFTQVALVAGGRLEHGIHLVIFGALLIFLYAPLQQVITTVLVGGFLLDTLVPTPFGSYLIALLAAVGVGSIVKGTLLPQLGLHTVIIQAVIFTATFHAVFSLILIIAQWLQVSLLSDFTALRYAAATWPQLPIHSLLAALVYWMYRPLYDRLQDHSWTQTLPRL